MTEEEKNKLKEKCEQCKKGMDAWLNGLDTDTEKIEEMKKHIFNYCPVCKIFGKIIALKI